MTSEQLLYLGPIFLTPAVGLFIAYFCWRGRPAPGAALFALVAFSTSWWSLCYGLEHVSVSLSARDLWFRVAFFGEGVVSPLLLLFALDYTGANWWRRTRYYLLLAVEPLLSVVVIWTNQWHGLFWEATEFGAAGPVMTSAREWGSWFYFHEIFTDLQVVLALALLVRAFIRSPQFFRRPAVGLAVGVSLPLALRLMWVADASPVPGVDLTHTALAFTEVVIALSFFRYRLFDVVPEARDAVIESLADGVAVVDHGARLVDINPALARVLGARRSALIGREIRGVVRDVFEETGEWLDQTQAVTELRKVVNERECCYEVRVSPTMSRRGAVASRVMVFRDITDRKVAEGRVKDSLAEKEVLLKEIHHRVKNNLQVISSLLKMQSRHVDDAATRELLEESQTRVKAMALIHERLYRSSDLRRIDFSTYVQELARDLTRTYGRECAARVESRVCDVHLPLGIAIPCALIISELITNALKHAYPGGRTGTISVSLTPLSAGSYVLAVEDDGVGLPDGFDIAGSESLGLRIVSTLARQLNGDVRTVESEGTRFEITFTPPKHTLEARDGEAENTGG